MVNKARINTKPSLRANYRRQHGVALLLALLIVATVASLAAYLAFEQQLWIRQAQNLSDRAQADAARRGVAAAVADFLDEDEERDIDHRGENWAKATKEVPAPFEIGEVEDAIVMGYAIDAQGRFNLNNLTKNGQASEKDIKLFKDLLRGVELNPELADAVVDWLDSDERQRPGGAEDLVYLAKDPPYRCANRAFTSVHELRLVEGFSSTEPEVQQRLASLFELVTVLPNSTNINVNTAAATLLRALYRNEISEEEAGKLYDELGTNPVKEAGELKQKIEQVSGKALTESKGIGFNTLYFNVTLSAQVGQLQRITQVLIERHAKDGTPSVIKWQNQELVIQEVSRDELK